MPLEEALCFGTSNTARALEIERKKGHIAPGMDADLLLMDEDLTMNTVIAGGQIMMENHVLLKKGIFPARKPFLIERISCPKAAAFFAIN